MNGRLPGREKEASGKQIKKKESDGKCRKKMRKERKEVKLGIIFEERVETKGKICIKVIQRGSTA